MIRNKKAKLNRIRFKEEEPICLPENENNIDDNAHKKAAEMAAISPIIFQSTQIDVSYHEVGRLIPNLPKSLRIFLNLRLKSTGCLVRD